MIDIQDLLKKPDLYIANLQKRGKDTGVVANITTIYENYKLNLKELEDLRSIKNSFNKDIAKFSGEEKSIRLGEMKELSEKSKELQKNVTVQKDELDDLIKKVPNILWDDVPLGKNDNDNPVVQTFGKEHKFDFEPKPYRELEVYKKYVAQDEGTKAMGSRGFYMKGEMARFQKVLFDFTLDYILQQEYELYYVPIMLNSKVLTGTGHLPDFDGQQYEIPINENTNYYLISSSEPSIMGYFMNKNLGNLERPILATCQSSCFRKESGSYGKDQQGILRVHQFEKIEMVVICRPEDAEKCFKKHVQINEHIWNSLGLYYRKVEVCTGDIPSKHFRQQDYEAWFPAAKKFREIGSNGNASDYQNRGLKISYTNDNGDKKVPWGLNDTGITFRTGLAILEQFQTKDGKVKLPKVLAERFGKEYIE